MGKIHCRINGRKYRCIITPSSMSFIDVKDKGRFITVDDNISIKKLIGKLFFKRKTLKK